MKHLRKFESMDEYSSNNDYYHPIRCEEIGQQDLYLIKSDVEQIKSKLGNSFSYTPSFVDGEMVGLYVTKYHADANPNESYFVFAQEDEYFFVHTCVWVDKVVMYHQFYKCDQIGGLLKCITDLSANRLDHQ